MGLDYSREREHVANPGADVDPASISPEDEVGRRARNLVAWKQSWDQTNDPKARQILLEELKKGAGVDFPLFGGLDNVDIAQIESGTAPMSFGILGHDRAPARAAPSLDFKILGQRSTPIGNMPPAIPPSLATPGERAENPAEAVTGRTQVPFPRDTTPGDPKMSRDLLRVGVETTGAFVGGTVGGIAGAAGGPVGAVAGQRGGEALGAGLGSLVSNVFDPQKEPFKEAAKTAGITLGTGLVATGVVMGFRKLVGKPSEAGKVLLDLMQKEGKVPLPGTVLESEFMRDTQSFGSAAFGTKELLNQANRDAETITTKAAQEYVSGFQRYHDGAKTLFRDADQLLASAGVPAPTTAVHGTSPTGTARTPGPSTQTSFMIKGDEAVRDALNDVINGYIRKTGRIDAMPSGLQKMYLWKQHGVEPRFTFEETQQIYDALFDKAAALEYAARTTATQEATGAEKHVAEYVREQAIRVKKAFDDALDTAVATKAVPPEAKAKLIAAREQWKLWTEGKELSRMVTAATEDIGGREVVKGSKLLAEINKLQKLDRAVGGKPTLSPEQFKNIRNYALAAQAVEQSQKQGAFVLSGRVGQIAGISGIMAAPFIGAAAPAVGAFGAFAAIAPHVIAVSFSNPTIAALMIRGLKMEPGSAAAARLSRELISVWEKERLIGPSAYDE